MRVKSLIHSKGNHLLKSTIFAAVIMLFGICCSCQSLVFEEHTIPPYISKAYPDWKKKSITSNAILAEVKRGTHKGKKRWEIDFFIPGRKITYEVTLDPKRAGMPLLKQGWGDVYFKASDIEPWYFIDLKVVRPIPGNSRNSDRVFHEYGLKGWDVGLMGDRECAVVVWNSGKDVNLGANNEAILKMADLGDGWTGFEIDLKGIKMGEKDSAKLTSSLHAYQANPFWGKTNRKRAVSTIDGTTVFKSGEKNLKKNCDKSFYWIVCHNVESQQTKGMIYLFHPDDFSKIEVSGGHFSATIMKKQVRMAVRGFVKQSWKNAVKEVKKEASGIVGRISKINWRKPFTPNIQDALLGKRLKELFSQPSKLSKIKSEHNRRIVKSFLKLAKPSVKIEDKYLGAYLSLKRDAVEIEKELVKVYLSEFSNR